MSLLAGYLALSRFTGATQGLDDRTALLAARHAAELGGCGWCIERTRHDCRAAGLTPEWSGDARDRAAQGFVQAVARAACTDGAIDQVALHVAEAFFQPGELAKLARIAADHHCVEESMQKRRQP